MEIIGNTIIEFEHRWNCGRYRDEDPYEIIHQLLNWCLGNKEDVEEELKWTEYDIRTLTDKNYDLEQKIDDTHKEIKFYEEENRWLKNKLYYLEA